MGKYTPLRTFLSSLPVSIDKITLTFSQIETILGAKLPPSAYDYPAWWANEKSPQLVHKRSWIFAGWRVERADLFARSVRFQRLSETSLKAQSPAAHSQVWESG